MPTIDEVNAQLESIDGWTKFLSRREINELPNVLWPKERIEQFGGGTYEGKRGVLVATNRRLIFLDKGLIRLKVEDFPYDKVTSAQVETGLIWGKLTILASGNKAVIDNMPKDQARSLGDHVRRRLNKPSPQQPGPERGTPSDDVVSQLERLAKLRQQGLLTDQEFVAQKRRLLGAPAARPAGPTRPRPRFDF